MDEIFPTFAELPNELSVHFQQMISWLEHTAAQGVTKYRNLDHIYQVKDEGGVVRCLFKKQDRLSSMIEASAYLLDHPINAKRRQSRSIYGFAGVSPTLYVKYIDGEEGTVEGVLVEFMENASTIKQYLRNHNDDIDGNDLHRISLLDVRLGNMDRSNTNILIEVEGNVQRFVPIDHEACLVERGQGYNLCKPWWLNRNGMDEPLLQECIDYVAGLDADEDLGFLGDCGWEIPLELFDRLRIFTTFLKKSVAGGFTPFHIGLMASFKCENLQFNLQSMVQSVLDEPEVGNFVIRVGNRIDERLVEYHDEIA